jgi:Tol biopolymer transport system component
VKSARLSPDGQRLATAIYEVEQGEQDLWIFDVKTNSGRRLTAEPAIRDAPVWSPDSTKLAFLFQADGNPPKVHVRSLGEQDAEEEMPAADFQAPTDWSPDGRFVAFVNTGFPRSANDTQGDVLVFDLAQGGKPIPLLNSRFHEANPAFSRVHFQRVRPPRSLRAGISVGRCAQHDWRTPPCFQRRRSSGAVEAGWEGAVLSRL